MQSDYNLNTSLFCLFILLLSCQLVVAQKKRSVIDVGILYSCQHIKNGMFLKKDTVRGSIDIEFCKMAGDISIDSTIFHSTVRLFNVDVKRKFNLKYSYFHKPTRLQVNFNQNYFSLDNVIFKDSAFVTFSAAKAEGSFMGCVFDRYADFSFSSFYRVWFNSRYKGVTFFFGINIGRYADFREAVFEDSVSFERSNFKGYAPFDKAIFKSKASFYIATFDSVDFRYCRFTNSNFRFCNFKGVVSFSYADLGQMANFRNTSIEKMYLRGTYLPDTLYFGHINKIENLIDFTFCETDSIENKECKIYLVGTDLTKIKLDYTKFRLYFLPEDDFDVQRSVYEELLAMQKKFGFLKGYEKLDVEYRQSFYKNENIYGLGLVDELWWGYGYKKENIFFNTLALFVIFFTVNTFLLGKLLVSVYDTKGIKNKYFALRLRKKANLLNKTEYYSHRLVLSMIYTGLIFFGVKFDPANLHYKNYWGLLYFVGIYVLGLICLAYMANVIIVGG